MSCKLEDIKNKFDSKIKYLLSKSDNSINEEVEINLYNNILTDINKLINLKSNTYEEILGYNDLIDNPPFYYHFNIIGEQSKIYNIEIDFFINQSNLGDVIKYFNYILKTNYDFGVERSLIVFDKCDYSIGIVDFESFIRGVNGLSI